MFILFITVIAKQERLKRKAASISDKLKEIAKALKRNIPSAQATLAPVSSVTEISP